MKRRLRVVKFGPAVVRQALVEWLESRGNEAPPAEAKVLWAFDEDSVKMVWSEDNVDHV